jgi:hypothetical protein
MPKGVGGEGTRVEAIILLEMKQILKVMSI